MIYDAQRTQGVVNRLVKLGNNLRLMMALIEAVQLGALLGIFGALLFGGVGTLIFAVLGILTGLALGIFIADALAAVIEWMAQVLISLQPRE